MKLAGRDHALQVARPWMPTSRLPGYGQPRMSGMLKHVYRVAWRIRLRQGHAVVIAVFTTTFPCLRRSGRASGSRRVIRARRRTFSQERYMDLIRNFRALPGLLIYLFWCPLPAV